MKRLLRILIPPKEWLVPVIILVGAMSGLTLYALIESKAVSYLSDDPKTCANCHVMTPQYTTWQNSSHREWASCNDCHVPQDNFFKKYLFKAKDGLYHASVFTSRTEPEVIRMKEAGVEVVQANCIRCHENQVTDAALSAMVEDHKELRTTRKCWECHQEVPHGSVHSLSSVKYYGKIPEEHQETVPEWLAKYLKESDNKKDKKDE
ncbi:cytochrome c nitrite reductase small subunit [Lutibacter maritimus]|jgi:cytochrome c nitrite reductase small subunit|uniref:Cytochrome c nitrite reductase small subunit n=1 Tax=Lutibacter maritimus TaxID=593133 RepID=A0A1I6PLU8_9FLAO|nr:cytochrome c nitrite reductase small subunit [Lutibacter maritimus]SFS41172.1 cytochrome c nitrite reductase small subunit [Lutibacter maritimus]